MKIEGRILPMTDKTSPSRSLTIPATPILGRWNTGAGDYRELAAVELGGISMIRRARARTTLITEPSS